MAIGDRNEARLGGPVQLGTSTTTIVTAATGYADIIKQVVICNTDTVHRTVTLAIGSAATAANVLAVESCFVYLICFFKAPGSLP